MGELYGREPECEMVLTFLAAAAQGPAQLLVEGEAGIGKTSIWQWALRVAAKSSTTVLACRPTQAELEFGFAALTDLLAPLGDDQLQHLPEPQRQALGVATLRMSPAEYPVDPRAIGTGTGTLLAGLVETGPMIVAIDDSQWMDASTTWVLSFALRRVRDLPVGLLLSRRLGQSGGFTTPTSSDGPAWRRELRLEPLGTAALHHVIEQELGVSLARPQMVPLAKVSGGNPFFAVELARSQLTASGDLNASQPLPAALRTLTAERFSRLSKSTQQALLAASLARHPERALFTHLGLAAALDEAEAAGIIACSAGRVAFTHPLLAAAAQDRVPAHVVRATHADLAGVTDDIEQRSRHLALATPGADQFVAAQLDSGVAVAEARGAHLAAVELARLAVTCTPLGERATLWARHLCLARLLHITGSTTEAWDILATLTGGAPTPQQQVAARLLEVEIHYELGNTAAAQDAARAAVEEAGDDLVARVRALLNLAEVTVNADETLRLAVSARQTLETAHNPPNDLAAWVIAEEVGARFNVGRGLDLDALDRALTLERTGRASRSTDQVAIIRPVLLKWADRHQEAVTALHELRRLAISEGNEGGSPYVAGHLPAPLMRLGRFAEAAAEAALHFELAEASGQSGQRAQARYNQALVAAHRGDLENAVRWAAELKEWTEHNGDDAWMAMAAASVLGLLALLGGDVVEARRQLDRWRELSVQIGLADPGISRFHGDHIEAVLGCGDLATAELLIEELHAAGTQTGRLSALGVAERCRALLAAARGDASTALEHSRRALELDRQCPIPLERARSLLVQGTVHRRAREKRAARATLTVALATFEEIGAGAWAARTRAELQRVGLRAASAFALTATEARVAELAGAGLTNRQVAERAFMSPKTVEANLARVYRKLNISSRAELGAAMTRKDTG